MASCKDERNTKIINVKLETGSKYSLSSNEKPILTKGSIQDFNTYIKNDLNNIIWDLHITSRPATQVKDIVPPLYAAASSPDVEHVLIDGQIIDIAWGIETWPPKPHLHTLTITPTVAADIKSHYTKSPFHVIGISPESDMSISSFLNISKFCFINKIHLVFYDTDKDKVALQTYP